MVADAGAKFFHFRDECVAVEVFAIMIHKRRVKEVRVIGAPPGNFQGSVA